jgi:hypothetical protein
VAALTSPKNTRWTHPCISGDPPAPGAARRRDLRQPLDGGAAGDGRREAEHRLQLRDAVQPRREWRVDAELLLEPQHRRERPQPGGMREQREDQPPVQPLAPRARRVALDLRPCLLDQLVVLHAGWARGHASHAAEAAVEVHAHLLGGMRALLVAHAHQHDPPTRRVHLLVEDGVAGARRQAEAAVDAIRDQLGIGRPVRVPGAVCAAR